MSHIVLTGASEGLGASIRELLLGDGHKVSCFSLPVLDVRNFDHCESFLKSIKAFDVLINNAGINILNWIEDLDERAWDAVMDTNCKGIFNMTKAAIPYLSKNRWEKARGGTIINILSSASYTPMTCSAVYNASKAGAMMLTRQMARELKPRHGIDVIGICPNKIADTEMTAYVESVVPGLRGWTPEFAEEYEKKNLPSGEAIPPFEIANFIRFLLGSKTNRAHLNGSIIPY